MIPRLAEVFKISSSEADQPGWKIRSEVNLDPLHGRDEQTYEPSIRTCEDGTGGMGGTTGSEDDGNEQSEEEIELAGAK